MSGHPDFDGLCQRICPPPAFYPYLGCALPCGLTRRQNALGCKPRISRAVSRAVTNFMRMSDATPPGPQTSACSTSLPRFSPAKSLRSVSGKVANPATMSCSAMILRISLTLLRRQSSQAPLLRTSDDRLPTARRSEWRALAMPTSTPIGRPPATSSPTRTRLTS